MALISPAEVKAMWPLLEVSDLVGASFLLGSCWGVCQDIGGPHAGLVAGCMNTAGQAGAVLSPVILPYFKDPAIPLCIAGSLYLLGALCWIAVDPRREIHLDGPPEAVIED